MPNKMFFQESSKSSLKNPKKLRKSDFIFYKDFLQEFLQAACFDFLQKLHYFYQLLMQGIFTYDERKSVLFRMLNQ